MLSRTIQNLQNVAVFAVSNMKSFFSAKYLSLEFDAFIAQETLAPFEGPLITFYVVDSNLMMT